MKRKPLRGVFPLMPFVLNKRQELDLVGLRNNIELFEELGFDGFVAFGTMGEFYAASDEEFRRVVDVCVDARKRMACVFGTTFHNTRECVRRTKYAEDAGADGVMVGPPYVVPCTTESAYEHYRILNDAVNELRIMVYNNPVSFKFNITPELWDKLISLDGIVALKDSSGDVVHRTRVISRIFKRINVFSAAEHLLLGDSLVGANGLISLAGPGVPTATLDFFRACAIGDLITAIPYHVKFTELLWHVTAENEVAWMKACAEFGGVKAGPPRAPYSPLDGPLRQKLVSQLEEIKAMVGYAPGAIVRDLSQPKHR